MAKIKTMKSYADLLAEWKNRVEDTRPDLNPFPVMQDRPAEEHDPVLRKIYDCLVERPTTTPYSTAFGKKHGA